MFYEWEKKKANKKWFKKRPCFRGNMICMFYSKCSGTEDEPMPLIAIGPDWKFSLLEMFLVNTPLLAASKGNEGWVAHITLATLVFQNFFFLMTILTNPGILQRDPSIHSKEYLRYLAVKNKESSLCFKCQLIKPKWMKDIYHCDDCNVCVHGHDHHCPWSSKCVA